MENYFFSGKNLKNSGVVPNKAVQANEGKAKEAENQPTCTPIRNLEYEIYSDNSKQERLLPFKAIYTGTSGPAPSFGATQKNLSFKGSSPNLKSKHPYPRSESEITHWLEGFESSYLYKNQKRRFSDWDIEGIRKEINMSNLGLFEKYALLSKPNGMERFSSSSIISLLEVSQTENIKLIEALINMETENGEPILNGNAIKSIVKYRPYLESGMEYFERIKPNIEKLAEVKDNRGNPLFHETDIDTILNKKPSYIFAFTDSELALIKELASIKTPEQENRFNSWDISEIMTVANEYNMDYIKELAKIEREKRSKYITDSKERLYGCEISELIKKTDKNDLEDIKALYNIKNYAGEWAISGPNIKYFFENRHNINIEILKELAQISTFDGKQRFTNSELPSLEKIANAENLDFIKELSKIRNEKDEYKYHGYDIEKLAEHANKENSDFIKELLNLKENGKERFNYYGINYIAKRAKADNIEFIRELINMKEDGKPRFYAETIAGIASEAKPEKMDIIYEIINKKDEKGNPRFEGSDIGGLCFYVNHDNLDIFREIEALKLPDNSPKFNSNNIYRIFYSLQKSKPEAKNILKELIHSSKKNGEATVNGFDIGTVLEAINSENLNYAKEMLKCKTKDGEPAYTEGHGFAQTLKGVFYKLDISDKPFSVKNEIYKDLLYMSSYANDKKSKEIIEEKITAVKKSMDKVTNAIPVSKEANNEFWQNFLVSANENNAKVIKNLGSVTEKYRLSGLPLEYSRTDFCKDLNDKLQTFDEEERTRILKKLDIQLKDNTYEGFINITALDKSNPNEAEINTLCEKFLLKNKINTGDIDTDKFLNSIIKGLPEFVNIIGKKQHSQHKYSLDTHILNVLKEVVTNPKFENLSNNDKMIIQIMTLLHDINKLEGIDDDNHELSSAIVANDILKRVQLPEFTKKRIVELIQNHNWFEQLNTGKISEHKAAVMFRAPGDALIAEIFAHADLKSTNEMFYNMYSKDLPVAVENMNKALDELYSTGNMVFPTRILNADKIPSEEYKGKTYKVLNLSKLPNDANLTQFG